MKQRDHVGGESEATNISPSDFTVSLADLFIVLAKKWMWLLSFTLLGVLCSGLFVTVAPKQLSIAQYLLEPIQEDGKVQANFSHSQNIFKSMRFSRIFAEEFINKLTELSANTGAMNESAVRALAHLQVDFGFSKSVNGDSRRDLQTGIALEFYRVRSIPSYRPMIVFDFSNVDHGRIEIRVKHHEDAVVLILSAIDAYNATVVAYNDFEKKSWEIQRSTSIENAVELFSHEYSSYERTLPVFDRKKVKLSVELARLSSMVDSLEKRNGVPSRIEQDEIGVQLNPDILGEAQHQVSRLGSIESSFTLLAQEVRLDKLTNRLGKLFETGAISKEISDEYLERIFQIISSRRQLKNSSLTGDYEANDAFRRFKYSLDRIPPAAEVELRAATQARVSQDMLKYLDRSGVLVTNPTPGRNFNSLFVGGCLGFFGGILLIFIYTIVLRLRLYSKFRDSYDGILET